MDNILLTNDGTQAVVWPRCPSCNQPPHLKLTFEPGGPKFHVYVACDGCRLDAPVAPMDALIILWQVMLAPVPADQMYTTIDPDIVALVRAKMNGITID